MSAPQSMMMLDTPVAPTLRGGGFEVVTGNPLTTKPDDGNCCRSQFICVDGGCLGNKDGPYPCQVYCLKCELPGAPTPTVVTTMPFSGEDSHMCRNATILCEGGCSKEINVKVFQWYCFKLTL